MIVFLMLMLFLSHGKTPAPALMDSVEVSLLDSIDCASLSRVKVKGGAFSHGHSKAAYFGKLDSVDVVLKRPFGDFLLPDSTAATSFSREVARIKALRGHPGVVHLYGGCLVGAPDELATVSERLLPWAAFVEQQQSVPWCVLAHTAVTAVTLIDFLQGAWSPRNRTAHGWMHCDLHHGAFAVSRNFVAKLVDYGGLMHRQEFPVEKASCSAKGAADQCAQGFCMRSWHTRHHATIGEFHCDTERGQCPGFDPSAMLWVVCESMLAETMTKSIQERHGSPDPNGVADALHGCLQPQRERRWSASAVGNTLRDYLARNNGFDCLRDAGVSLDPAYYDVKQRITLDNLEQFATRARPVWTPPTHVTKLDPFPGDVRPK
jgi:hypothetical protein